MVELRLQLKPHAPRTSKTCALEPSNRPAKQTHCPENPDPGGVFLFFGMFLRRSHVANGYTVCGIRESVLTAKLHHEAAAAREIEPLTQDQAKEVNTIATRANACGRDHAAAKLASALDSASELELGAWIKALSEPPDGGVNGVNRPQASQLLRTDKRA